MTAYRYADGDLLADPHVYMYTPFEGPGFLRAYVAQREAAAARLESGAPGRLADELAERASQVLPARPGEVEVETRAVLLDLAGSPAGGEDWLAFFISRFEVTKRLYERYTSALEPAAAEFELLDNYALLSLVAGARYAQGRNLKHLNVVLKLGDLLTSRAPASASALGLTAAREALEQELAIVRAFLAEHEVQI